MASASFTSERNGSHQLVLRKISVNVFDEATNVSTTRSTWLNPGCPDCASTPQRRS